MNFVKGYLSLLKLQIQSSVHEEKSFDESKRTVLWRYLEQKKSCSFHAEF